MRPSAGLLSVLLFGLTVTVGLSGLTVTMVNRTGDTIVEIYVSKNSSSWNNDVLKEGAMLNGERLRVTFPGDAGIYYVKAVTAGGGEYLLDERHIKEGTTIVITAADGVKDGISSGFSAKIINSTGKAIHQIYVLPKSPKKAGRGEGLLGEKEVMLQGEERSIRFSAGFGTKIFSIELVDEEGASYLRSDVDVSRENRMYFTEKDKRSR